MPTATMTTKMTKVTMIAIAGIAVAPADALLSVPRTAFQPQSDTSVSLADGDLLFPARLRDARVDLVDRRRRYGGASHAWQVLFDLSRGWNRGRSAFPPRPFGLPAFTIALCLDARRACVHRTEPVVAPEQWH